MKNSNDTIGNRTRDLLARSAVPQPTAPSRVAFINAAYISFNFRLVRISLWASPISYGFLPILTMIDERKLLKKSNVVV